jgi:hypothetical protein
LAWFEWRIVGRFVRRVGRLFGRIWFVRRVGRLFGRMGFQRRFFRRLAQALETQVARLRRLVGRKLRRFVRRLGFERRLVRWLGFQRRIEWRLGRGNLLLRSC